MNAAEQAAARARWLLERRRPAEAERLLREALAADPQDRAAQFELVWALAAQARRGEALETAQALVASAPDWAPGHLALASQFLAAGEAAAAERAAHEAILRAPIAPMAHALHGRALLALGRAEEADLSARLGLALDPEHPVCARLHADALVALGDPGAPAAAADALRLDPLDAEAHGTLGRAWLRAERPHEAFLAYRDALLLQPDESPYEERALWAFARSSLHVHAWPPAFPGCGLLSHALWLAAALITTLVAAGPPDVLVAHAFGASLGGFGLVWAAHLLDPAFDLHRRLVHPPDDAERSRGLTFMLALSLAPMLVAAASGAASGMREAPGAGTLYLGAFGLAGCLAARLHLGGRPPRLLRGLAVAGSLGLVARLLGPFVPAGTSIGQLVLSAAGLATLGLLYRTLRTPLPVESGTARP